jgi:hypothetical protein
MHPCIILFVSVMPVISGYWLAGRIRSISAPERLAVASLAGLCTLLLGLSLVSYFAPLSGWHAWSCLLPACLTLLSRPMLSRLGADAAEVLLCRRSLALGGIALLYLAVMTWPETWQRGLLFYDGTSNHDAFYWVAGGKYLQAHSYMDGAPAGREHPWAVFGHISSGWRPEWGRAGAESLLALVATVSRLDPVEVYLPTTAALLLPWIAAVYLVVRTFWTEGLTIPGSAALFALEPMFLYFRANENLPNLLGVLAGAAAVVATARCLGIRAERIPWLALLSLSASACFFSYPEIVPFLVLPGALLLARATVRAPRLVPWVLLSCVLGLALNPATSLRACHGFAQSFQSARADRNWADIFAGLGPFQYLPALVTVSVHMVRYLGAVPCLIASIALLSASVLAFQRAKDRYGAVASLSGGALLAAYTMATGFHYGWQKTAQFSGVFLVALIPIAALDAGWRARGRLGRPLAFAVVLLLATGVAFQSMELQKWSRRKFLDRDFLGLRAAAGMHPGATIVVDSATFRMSFFYGMWSAYLLPDNRLLYAGRGASRGGYLEGRVLTEADPLLAGTRFSLVGPEWAETFDANSEALFSSREAVLLRSANRVTRLEGLRPETGVPTLGGDLIAIDLVPHARSELRLTLAPSGEGSTGPRSWRVRRNLRDAPLFACEVDGPPPWRMAIPLEPAQLNRIEIRSISSQSAGPISFAISGIAIVDR